MLIRGQVYGYFSKNYYSSLTHSPIHPFTHSPSHPFNAFFRKNLHMSKKSSNFAHNLCAKA